MIEQYLVRINGDQDIDKANNIINKKSNYKGKKLYLERYNYLNSVQNNLYSYIDDDDKPNYNFLFLTMHITQNSDYVKTYLLFSDTHSKKDNMKVLTSKGSSYKIMLPNVQHKEISLDKLSMMLMDASNINPNINRLIEKLVKK